MRHSIISSCQSAATNEIVKRCWSWVYSWKQRYSKISGPLPLPFASDLEMSQFSISMTTRVVLFKRTENWTVRASLQHGIRTECGKSNYTIIGDYSPAGASSSFAITIMCLDGACALATNPRTHHFRCAEPTAPRYVTFMARKSRRFSRTLREQPVRNPMTW